MHEKSRKTWRFSGAVLPLLLVVALPSPTLSAPRPETFSYGGKSYKIIEVIAVEDEKATLKAVGGETVEVPVRFLSARLRAKAEQLAKAEAAAKSAPLDPKDDPSEDAATIEAALQEALATGIPPKVWVTGSTLTPDKELSLNSTVSAIELKIGRDGTPLPRPKTRRNAIFLPGLVVIEGLAPRGENVLVEYFGWDTGETVMIGRSPARVITRREPEPQPLTGLRDWTNLDGKVLRATLWTVKDGEGEFSKEDGGRFRYKTEMLSPADRDFIDTSIAAKLAEWRKMFR